MNPKKIAVLILKFIALTILYFVCFTIASALLFPSNSAPPASPGQASFTLAALVAVCSLNTMVLTYIILRSRWTSWRLILAIFFISYGTMTIMSQIETAVFVTRLPSGMLPRIFLMGVIVTGLFSPLAVLILGKRKRDIMGNEANLRLVMPPGEWIWKAGLIAIAYVAIYFTFGYFVAWRNAAVREYYGGTDSGSFVAQMRRVILDTPWLPLLQMLRAVMWMAIAIPVIRMMKGQWWEAGLAVSLLFGILMNSQLLLPNPFMPEEVRMAHLAETASSNFLFGWLVVWLLLFRHKPSSDLSYS